MNIQLHEIEIRDLVAGYSDKGDEGVVGYGGKLDIRPAYQREFIYKDKQREAVVDSVMNGFPLNVMYWARREDGSFEVMDGQQRTISLCQFASGDFSYDMRFFANLTDAERERFLAYPLMVYVCEGTDEEKLRWFQTINIAGEKLTDQELRNAVYAGPWTSDAKRHFSRPGCAAYKIASSYMDGSPIRQDYLETALRWIGNGADPRFYMALHQHDPNANPLWLYFQQVVNWAKATFPVIRAPMKKVPWGLLYNKFAQVPQDPKALEARVAKLVADSDVQKKSGIWEYVLDGDERHLGIRAFEWRPTTSRRGATAAAPFPPTARCSARTATGARGRNEERPVPRPASPRRPRARRHERPDRAGACRRFLAGGPSRAVGSAAQEPHPRHEAAPAPDPVRRGRSFASRHGRDFPARREDEPRSVSRNGGAAADGRRPRRRGDRRDRAVRPTLGLSARHDGRRGRRP